jgi:hypothetical protein
MLLIACATVALPTKNVQAEYTRGTDGWPEWVAESMANEARKPKLRKVKLPDDTLSTRIPGKPDEPQAIDSGWYFPSDIKAESPLECYIYTTDLDMSSLTNYLAETNIEAIGESYGTVDNRTIYHVDAGATSGYPYMALEWLYTVTGETQTLVAFTKVRVAVKSDIALACTHNAIGYRETFAAAFEDFVASTEYQGSDNPPYYEEIATMDINGMGFGVAYTTYTVDEDGDTKEYVAESSLLPTAASSLMYSDSISYSYSTPDHELISARQVDVENGEITNNLTLERNEDGDWVSSGTLQGGKPLEAVIDGEQTPDSNLGMIAMARDLFAGEEQSVTAKMWIPTADPTRFLDASLTRDDTEVERQGTVSLGPINISGGFDESGNMVDGKMTFGPITVDIRRVWSKGSVFE